MEQLSYTPDSDVFVPKNQEEEYLQKHNIERRILSNGAQIIGMPRVVSDLAHADVHFTFPAGYYKDPPGKEGIHHLFEHLIMNPVGNAPEGIDVNRNASTSPYEIDVFVEGIANPNFRDYSLWPMLPRIAQAIKFPLEGIADLDSEIKREIKVIYGEMTEVMDYNYHLVRTIDRIIFDSSNPILKEGLGSEKSLANISARDVKTLADRVIVPDGLNVSFFTEGEMGTSKILADELEKLMSDFPRAEVKSSPIDRRLSDKLNPTFKQGKTYPTHLEPNGRLRIFLPWILERKEWTTEAMALSRLLPVINQNLFNYTRRKGFGYSAGANISEFEDYVMAFLEIDMGSQPNIIETLKNTIYPEIRKSVFESIGDNEFVALNRKGQLVNDAVPMQTVNRLNLLMHGLKSHNRIVDPDSIKSLNSQVTTAQLQDWRDKFLSSEPAFIIAGDIFAPKNRRI